MNWRYSSYSVPRKWLMSHLFFIQGKKNQLNCRRDRKYFLYGPGPVIVLYTACALIEHYVQAQMECLSRK